MKRCRWYEIVGDDVYIYDQPYSDRSLIVSVVTVDDLPYYRKTFNLFKVWGDSHNA